MTEKQFHIRAEDIKRLVQHNGSCIATDTITVDGRPVGYMYHEPPDNDADTGWRFTAGGESDEYMDDADNHGVYTVNTIANYDSDILPFINAPVGSAFARNLETGEFERVDSLVDSGDCLHPEFPIVTGKYPLTSSWVVFLPLKFNRRIKDGSLALWRPGITLYFNVWNNDHNNSIDTRLAQLKTDISPNAFELREQQADSVRRFSYRLIENDVSALYGFVVANDGHLQIAVYLNDESDVDLARSIFSSVTVKTA